MKKLILFTFLTVTLIFSTSFSNCEAKDVWVTRWASENVDIYVMDDTITSGSSNGSRYFKVSTKQVRNGQLLKVINWSYSKYNTDMWRYESSTMNGTHTTVVIPRDGIFEFCMKKLGWSYRIVDMWYY